jgi:hypothetical protein
MRIVDLCAEYNRAVSKRTHVNSPARANELQVKGHKSKVIGRSLVGALADLAFVLLDAPHLLLFALVLLPLPRLHLTFAASSGCTSVSRWS